MQSALSRDAVTGPDGAITWTVPLQVSISLGKTRVAPSADRLSPTHPDRSTKLPAATSAAPRESDALLAAQEAFKRADVIGVRGYVFVDGLITSSRAIVVTVTEKQSIAALQEGAVDPLPSTFKGFQSK